MASIPFTPPRTHGQVHKAGPPKTPSSTKSSTPTSAPWCTADAPGAADTTASFAKSDALREISILGAGPQTATMVEVRCRTMRQEMRCYRHAKIWVPLQIQSTYNDLVAPFAVPSPILRFDFISTYPRPVDCLHIRQSWDMAMARCPPSGAPLVEDYR